MLKHSKRQQKVAKRLNTSKSIHAQRVTVDGAIDMS